MGKVLTEYPIYLAPKNAERKGEMIVIRDISDEGYGVYLDYPYESVSSSTIVFGHGDLSEKLSISFYNATCNYFEYIGRKATSLSELDTLNSEWCEERFFSFEQKIFDVERMNKSLEFISKYQEKYVNEKNQWFQTDDFQWVLIRGVSVFEVVEVLKNLDDHCFGVYHTIINLDDFSEEQILNYIKPYGYKSRGEMEKIYGGKYDSNQVIAECIAETEMIFNNGVYVDTMADLQKHLQQTYEITLHDYVGEVS